jgi:DNA-binding TFAR19-related protein (PDSD5 family)
MAENNPPKKKEKKESASEMLYNVLKEILDTQALILQKLDNVQATRKESAEDRAKAWKGM